MKIQSTILCSMTILSSPSGICATGIGADHGLAAAKVIGHSFEKSSEALAAGLRDAGLKTVQEALPAIDKLQGTVVALSGTLEKVSDTLAIALKDAGANAGIAVADKIGSTLNATCVSVKTAGASVKAVAMAHPVITTAVIGTVVVVTIAYGSYKIYRYYYPKKSAVDEMQTRLAIAKAEAAILKFQKVQIKRSKEETFKQSLMQHASSTQKTPTGIPQACQQAARELAIVAGQKKVDKISAAYSKYATP